MHRVIDKIVHERYGLFSSFLPGIIGIGSPHSLGLLQPPTVYGCRRYKCVMVQAAPSLVFFLILLAWLMAH